MEHCQTCNKNLEEQCDKFSIFDLDAVTDRCFAYKIAQITGIEIPFGKCEKYICINCHDILIQIQHLEKKLIECLNLTEESRKIEEERDSTLKLTSQETNTNDISHDLQSGTDLIVRGSKIIEGSGQAKERLDLSNIPKNEDFREKSNEDQTQIPKGRPAKYLPDEKKYECTECGKEFLERKLIITHLDTFHNKFEGFELKFATGSIKRKMIKKERKHECEICKKSFYIISDLMRHRTTHNGEKAFKCRKCPSSFSAKNSLVLHIYKIHEGGEPTYQCTECPKAFYKHHKLNIHVKTSHFGERSYKCGKCDLVLSTKATLKRHTERIHDKSKVTCKECLKEFNRYDMIGHIKRVHRNEKPVYFCDECKLPFFNKITKNKHKLKVHNDPNLLPCPFCSFPYSSKDRLEAHKKKKHSKVEMKEESKDNLQN